MTRMDIIVRQPAVRSRIVTTKIQIFFRVHLTDGFIGEVDSQYLTGISAFHIRLPPYALGLAFALGFGLDLNIGGFEALAANAGGITVLLSTRPRFNQ